VWGEERCVRGFGVETLIEVDHLKDGRIILRWIFRKWDGAMVWIYLAQDRDRWRAIVNAVLKLRVP
jgi:hypothetical protein